jgi:hypothetical protein
MIVCLDTNVVVYLIEGAPIWDRKLVPVSPFCERRVRRSRFAMPPCWSGTSPISVSISAATLAFVTDKSRLTLRLGPLRWTISFGECADPYKML